jgi:hypothetical protein
MSKIKVIPSGVKNKPFIVSVGGYIKLYNGDMMYIPRGYCFDNASIPKIFKFLYDTFKIGFFNYQSKAFLVHDFLYHFRGYQTSSKFLIRPVSRVFADYEMTYQMRIKGFSEFKIKVFFLAVRMFGWISFGKM